MEQPGKVLHWQVDADISGSPALPDDRYRTLHWVSNVAGAEGSVYRKFNGRGELVSARWVRADGSYVTYRRGAAPELVVHPSASVIRAEVAALPLSAQLVVERYLAQRDRDAPEAQRQRSAEWFVRIARAEDDATLQMIRTEDGREAYYIQQDVHPAPKGLKQLVVQTYIESEGYRRYRLKTTRQRLDGSYHLEDARWSGFTESTPNDFARHTLTDLLQQQSPVVMNAARIAGTDARK